MPFLYFIVKEYNIVLLYIVWLVGYSMGIVASIDNFLVLKVIKK